MHPRLIWAVARKDVLDLWMNKAAMAGLLFPILLSFIYLMIGNMLDDRDMEILVHNPGGSGLAQVVTEAIPGARLVQADSAEAVALAFPASGKKADYAYALGLVIPADFDQQLHQGRQPELQVYFNGQSVTPITQALVQASITGYSRLLSNPEPPVKIQATEVNVSSFSRQGFEAGQVYVPMALLVSLVVGITFMPQLLIEEKEKKTLRMLMVSPVSFEDVLIGKLLVVLVYQLVLSGVVLVIQKAFTGQVGLVVLYTVLGGVFSVALGLLIGSVFNTVSAASAVEGPVIGIFILAGIFVGPLGELMGSNLVSRIAKLMPTYYIAEGVANASQGLGTPASHLLDIGVVLASTIILLAVSAWVLRRQSAVAAMI